METKPKIAIVCDWITGVGGAERVILALHDLFPDAPVFTSTYEPGTSTAFKNVDIRTSWMQRLPKFLRRHQLLTLPRQWHFGHLKLKGYDFVISAGSAEAKSVRAIGGKHINICYTPTLYYWVKPENYLQKNGTDGLNIVWRLGLKLLLPSMRRWDKKAAKRPDVIYAISTAVQQRIKQYYDRESRIIYPPVDVERFQNTQATERHGFVTYGRQVQHKRFDLAIAACNSAKVPLLVIGDGPEHSRLESMAGPTITFKQNVSDSELPALLASAEAFIFTNEEDFGIVAVEAQAAGTPVIAYRAGGALDTVIEDVTGEFFDEQTTASLNSKLTSFDKNKYRIDPLVAHASKFSGGNFRNAIIEAVTLRE